MRSVSVVLPESMWAEIPMLRIFSMGTRDTASALSLVGRNADTLQFEGPDQPEGPGAYFPRPIFSSHLSVARHAGATLPRSEPAACPPSDSEVRGGANPRRRPLMPATHSGGSGGR